MTPEQYRRCLRLARQLGGDYAAGYMRGLRRHVNSQYGTDIEHAAWMALAADHGASARGRGYLDGLHGAEPRLRE